MATYERSAGVVVFRDDPQAAGERSFLLLNYGRFWDYPKGHIETGESDPSAAQRELEEETGIRDAEFIPGFHERIAYFFRDRRKGLVRKEVVFFLARTARKRIAISDEHVGYEFLPFSLALERLTYATAKAVLRKAEAFLSASEH